MESSESEQTYDIYRERGDTSLDYLLGRHFISLFLILLFAIRLSSQRTTRDKELNYFWLTVISCFLLVLEDQLEMMASEDPDLRFWRILLSVAGYVLRSTATVGLVFVVRRPEQGKRWLWWIPCIINLAVCCTAFFTDIAFGFDDDYVFYRGPLGYVAFIVPLSYLAAILILTFQRYVDRRRRADRLILFACTLFCLLSALLDATRGGVRLHEAILISSIFFYIFLRSYDVRRDSLTRILNRQSLYDDCESLQKYICAAASLDMNGLKTINNTQGHHAGDTALKKIGECLREVTDPDVRTYRIGGDEFVILFFRADEPSVQNILNDLRISVEDAGYSIAYGYAMREENDDPESMIRRSDMKMFEQKAQYYREKKHDRRKARSERADQYPADARKTLEESPQPVAVYQFIDHRVETLVVSDGFCKLFGYPDHHQALHILDENMYRDVHPMDQERLSGAMLRFSEGKEELDVIYRTRAGVTSDYRIIHARGIHAHTGTDARIAHVWYMDEGIYMEGDEENGTLMNQALNRALHEESILNASHYDELTGLPSLTWFFQLCEARKTKAPDEEPQNVLLYIDLSGMKYFNDKYGFTEGDKLLKSFSMVLLEAFGKENCCHIAADRFASSTMEDGLEERLRRLFDATSRCNSGNTLPVRVGIYSASAGDISVTSAFDRAKLACDSIRHSDSSCFNYYKKGMSDVIRRRQYVIANIDRAIKEKWIQAYYQPIVSAADEKICDEEALARWIDPAEGFLSPADFVPHLEDTGLIYKMDLYILDQVIEKMLFLQQSGQPVVPHSINLSRSDFEACDMVEEITRRVDGAGIRHNMINIEITESVIGSDFEFINEQVNRFRENGFAVWMDDFGSGYSSLDVLQSIRFDLIKFDMSFMRKLDEGENGRIILTELMKLAGRLKLDTVCEGVEKEEQVRFLQSIGCAKLQGYYFSKPVPFELQTAGALSMKNPGPEA